MAFGLALAAVGTLVALTTRSAFERERARVADGLRGAAADGAFWADQLLPQVEGIFSGLAEHAALLDPGECRAALRGLQVLAAQGNVTVFDGQGRFVCSLVEPVGGTAAVPGDWFAQAVGSDRPIEHAPVLDSGSGRPSTTITLPLPSSSGREGILAATLYTDAETLTPPPGMPAGLVMLDLSHDGNLVLSVSEGAPYAPGPAPRGADLAGQTDSPAVRVDPDGVERFYVGVTAARSGRRVLAGLPLPAVFAPARAELRTHLLVTAGIMGAMVGLAMGLWRALVRPIRRLRAAIDASSTDDTVEAPEAGPAEVAAVAQAFNQAMGRRRQLERELSDEALHDPLTGLPNRLLLDDRLIGALARQRRSESGLLGVAFLDLDRFKLLNDSHGHAVGDQVLAAVARRWRRPCGAPTRWRASAATSSSSWWRASPRRSTCSRSPSSFSVP